ncbi:hypothetical protein EI94DRAFT_1810290 [Lactarius quietus]|nr:hypothetical protein EI94DRAFT_1810290 [Lactarius quietus]
MSLCLLIEKNTLTLKACISLIAGMLLYEIQIHDNIRQFKRESAVVARKLVDVVRLVIRVSVGDACERLGEDVVHMQSGLEQLQSLEGIEEVLKECANPPASRIKKVTVLLRADILSKIDICDNMLSHLKVTLRTQLSQLTQGREVHTVAAAGSASSSRTATSALSKSKASAPQMCYGSEAELSNILEMIFGPLPAQIVILGPGGYRKTTLARAVLENRSVRQRFGDARYFVACKSATTSGDLLIELAKALGLLKAGSDGTWPYIKASLTEKECIICPDNFESPWDQAAETRNSVEELLSKITSLQPVTVLVTMRGTESSDSLDT